MKTHVHKHTKCSLTSVVTTLGSLPVVAIKTKFDNAPKTPDLIVRVNWPFTCVSMYHATPNLFISVHYFTARKFVAILTTQFTEWGRGKLSTKIKEKFQC